MLLSALRDIVGNSITEKKRFNEVARHMQKRNTVVPTNLVQYVLETESSKHSAPVIVLNGGRMVRDIEQYLSGGSSSDASKLTIAPKTVNDAVNLMPATVPRSSPSQSVRVSLGNGRPPQLKPTSTPKTILDLDKHELDMLDLLQQDDDGSTPKSPRRRKQTRTRLPKKKKSKQNPPDDKAQREREAAIMFQNLQRALGPGFTDQTIHKMNKTELKTALQQMGQPVKSSSSKVELKKRMLQLLYNYWDMKGWSHFKPMSNYWRWTDRPRKLHSPDMYTRKWVNKSGKWVRPTKKDDETKAIRSITCGVELGRDDQGKPFVRKPKCGLGPDRWDRTGRSGKVVQTGLNLPADTFHEQNKTYEDLQDASEISAEDQLHSPLCQYSEKEVTKNGKKIVKQFCTTARGTRDIQAHSKILAKRIEVACELNGLDDSTCKKLTKDIIIPPKFEDAKDRTKGGSRSAYCTNREGTLPCKSDLPPLKDLIQEQSGKGPPPPPGNEGQGLQKFDFSYADDIDIMDDDSTQKAKEEKSEEDLEFDMFVNEHHY